MKNSYFEIEYRDVHWTQGYWLDQDDHFKEDKKKQAVERCRALLKINPHHSFRLVKVTHEEKKLGRSSTEVTQTREIVKLFRGKRKY